MNYIHYYTYRQCKAIVSLLFLLIKYPKDAPQLRNKLKVGGFGICTRDQLQSCDLKSAYSYNSQQDPTGKNKKQICQIGPSPFTVSVYCRNQNSYSHPITALEKSMICKVMATTSARLGEA